MAFTGFGDHVAGGENAVKIDLGTLGIILDETYNDIFECYLTEVQFVGLKESVILFSDEFEVTGGSL